MQQIERYGVLALLLLVVTLITVGLWGPDPDTARAGQRDTETAAAEEERGEARQRRRIGGDTIPLNRGAGAEEAEDRLAQHNQRVREQAAQQINLQAQPGPDTIQAEGPAPRSHRRQGGTTVQHDQAQAQPQPQPRDIIPMTPPASTPSARAEVPPPIGPVYVVREGDSLERIARRRLGDGSRSAEIARLNGIDNPDRIRIDQKLQLPADARSEDLAAPRPRRQEARAHLVSTEGGTWTYTVRSGDALSRIAERELGTQGRMDEILALNPGLKADRIYAGQELAMPPARSGAVADAGRGRSGFLGAARGAAPRGVN